MISPSANCKGTVDTTWQTRHLFKLHDMIMGETFTWAHVYRARRQDGAQEKRETKQQPSRDRSGNQISCCLVSLHFLCDILSTGAVLWSAYLFCKKLGETCAGNCAPRAARRWDSSNFLEINMHFRVELQCKIFKGKNYLGFINCILQVF